MAKRILEVAGARAMFNKAKAAYEDVSEDLLNHLSPSSGFEVDLGGEG